MNASMTNPRVERLRKRLEGRNQTQAKAGLAESDEMRQRIGQAIRYAIARAGRTQKEVWVELGHSEGARLSRWIAGTERPALEALFAVPWLQQPLVLAFAELAGFAIQTEIVLKRA